MTLQASLADLAQVIGAQPLGKERRHLRAEGITTDTRQLQPGQVFVALRGETFNGHEFVGQALAQGAVGAVVDGPVTGDDRELVVPNTLSAYQGIARWWRRQLGTPLVAITGSVGKTTTKEMIAAALSHQGPILKTRANFNNEIGVPKTLLELAPHHRFGVVEMGMRGPGEIALLARTAEPNVAVITNVGTAHIGRLGSEQAIAHAKCELLAELSPSGTAVLNYDNDRLMTTAKGVWSGTQITFGLTGGDVTGQLRADGQLEIDGLALPLPLPGRHNALNLLAVVAVMRALDLDWRVLQQGFTVDLPKGRAQRLQWPNDIVILDETYNAGVESMTAALQMLKDTPGQRHIAVLGTMKELGDRAVELHHRVGTVARDLQLDQLLILADPEAATALATGANPVACQQFPHAEALIDYLKDNLQPGDRILFKASRAVALDQVIDRLQPQASP
ncbi:MAG: UDP-N-acetylmuramoyl-tripeptide--D-alanyl-D-alanine ligase [Leptolyngbya sp. RL_3_1]|nr:UDP-N-acetylmuramoyl-tripeptide--D-alanyl-D-alanine ligase [Leptolyngbya sp. RL_3_1]